MVELEVSVLAAKISVMSFILGGWASDRANGGALDMAAKNFVGQLMRRRLALLMVN